MSKFDLSVDELIENDIHTPEGITGTNVENSRFISVQEALDAVEESRRLNPYKGAKEACAHEYEHRHFLKILMDIQPADVVPVSAYKQVMLERDTVVEQLKQIGKDIREVMDDVVHLQRLLSADVVPVVRCRDCRYHVAIDKCCHPDGLLCAEDNNYCNYGERRKG